MPFRHRTLQQQCNNNNRGPSDEANCAEHTPGGCCRNGHPRRAMVILGRGMQGVHRLACIGAGLSRTTFGLGVLHERGLILNLPTSGGFLVLVGILGGGCKAVAVRGAARGAVRPRHDFYRCR